MKMITKGDKVSVLDEAIDGIVLEVKNKEVTIETTEGFTMTYFVNELIKINNSNVLTENNGSFNLHKIKLEKEIPKPRSFVKEKKSKHENPVPECAWYGHKLSIKKVLFINHFLR